jgi:hypothetical protein
MSLLDETRARRYLLGQMSEDEADALEGEYFADGEVLEQVWGVENDLVDAYVAGALGPEERAAFEGHYLATPVHRDRVASARALRAASGSRATPQDRRPSWTPWLGLAAALLLVAAGWWIGRERPPVQNARATQPTPQAAATPTAVAPVAPTSPAGPRAVVAAFALSPVLLRGGQETPVLRVAPRTDELALTLEGERPEGVPRDARLAFVVTTVEGEMVARGSLVPRGDGLGVARIMADRVPPGDYILAVRLGDTDAHLRTARGGEEEAALRHYFFRIHR